MIREEQAPFAKKGWNTVVKRTKWIRDHRLTSDAFDWLFDFESDASRRPFNLGSVGAANWTTSEPILAHDRSTKNQADRFARERERSIDWEPIRAGRRRIKGPTARSVSYGVPFKIPSEVYQITSVVLIFQLVLCHWLTWFGLSNKKAGNNILPVSQNPVTSVTELIWNEKHDIFNSTLATRSQLAHQYQFHNPHQKKNLKSHTTCDIS